MTYRIIRVRVTADNSFVHRLSGENVETLAQVPGEKSASLAVRLSYNQTYADNYLREVLQCPILF
jgi:hypothetical protein